MSNRSDPPPPGWRPPTVGDQASLIIWVLIGVTVVADVLLVVAMFYRPLGEASVLLKRRLGIAAVPMNLVGIGAVCVWLWRRRSKR